MNKAKLRELCDSFTKLWGQGPWHFREATEADDWELFSDEVAIKQDDSGVPIDKVSGDFIAASLSALPQLLDENARLREALEFYADDSPDPDDDHMHGGYWMGHCADCSNPVTRFVEDAGDKARAALKDTNETP